MFYYHKLFSYQNILKICLKFYDIFSQNRDIPSFNFHNVSIYTYKKLCK